MSKRQASQERPSQTRLDKVRRQAATLMATPADKIPDEMVEWLGTNDSSFEDAQAATTGLGTTHDTADLLGESVVQSAEPVWAPDPRPEVDPGGRPPKREPSRH